MSENIQQQNATPEFRTHHVMVKGKSGVYHVKILENAKTTMSDCNCGKHKCYHIIQVLAGVKTNIVSEEGLVTQQRIIESLNTTEQGRKKLRKIRNLISKNNNCPNCLGTNIKVYKRSIILTKYLGFSEKHSCLDCKYNWER